MKQDVKGHNYNLEPLEFDRLVGQISGDIFLAITNIIKKKVGCVYITPAITYKVRHCLSKISNLADIPCEQLYVLSKDLATEVKNILLAYDIDISAHEELTEKVEQVIREQLEDFHTRFHPNRPC